MGQVLSAILLFAVIGALLGALWLVVRGSKRRTRRIGEQLRSEIAPTSSQLLIRTNRKENAAWAVFFGVLVADGIQLIIHGRVVVGLVGALFFAPFAGLYARRAMRRSPELVVDGEGITIGASGDAIQWGEIEQVHLRERRLYLGLSHHELVLDLGERAASRTDRRSITVQLEGLSMSWNDVASAVQARFGRRMATE